MNCIVRTVVILACCVVATDLHAQTISRSTDTAKKDQPLLHNVKPKGPKAIRHELSVGFRLNSNGWGVFTDYGKVKPKDLKHPDMFHNVRFFQLEFTEKKSPREQKLASNSSSGSKFIYGKINNFYALKLGYGIRKMLAGKPDPGTVSIHWVNVLGPSLGMLKPYYLNINGDPNAIKYSDATQSEFLNQGIIEGNAGFGKGLGEMKFIPGGYFRSAIHFDFSASKKSVLGVETGFNVEYYSSDIQLLANEKGTPYFFDIFLAIQFGKRW
jgi:hypothetical protein